MRRWTVADVLGFGLELAKAVFRPGEFYRPHAELIWHPMYDDPRLTTAQRRANRDAMLPAEWTGEVWTTCKKWWKNKCAACGSRKNLQRDHIVPVAHMWCPGAVPSNLMPLCRKCNMDKSAQDLADWYRNVHGNPTDVIEKVWDWQEHCFKRGWN